MTSISVPQENSPKIGSPFERHIGFDYPGSSNSMNAVFADSRINAARDALNEVVDLVDGQTVEGEVVVANSASDPSVEPLPLSLTPRQSIVRDQMTSILVRQEVMRRRY